MKLKEWLLVKKTAIIAITTVLGISSVGVTGYAVNVDSKREQVRVEEENRDLELEESLTEVLETDEGIIGEELADAEDYLEDGLELTDEIGEETNGEEKKLISEAESVTTSASSSTKSGTTSSSNTKDTTSNATTSTSSNNTSSNVATNSNNTSSNVATNTHTCNWVSNTVVIKEAYSYKEDVVEWVKGMYFQSIDYWMSNEEAKSIDVAFNNMLSEKDYPTCKDKVDFTGMQKYSALAKALTLSLEYSSQWWTDNRYVVTGTETINVPAETKTTYVCSTCGATK